MSCVLVNHSLGLIGANLHHFGLFIVTRVPYILKRVMYSGGHST